MSDIDSFDDIVYDDIIDDDIVITDDVYTPTPNVALGSSPSPALKPLTTITTNSQIDAFSNSVSTVKLSSSSSLDENSLVSTASSNDDSRPSPTADTIAEIDTIVGSYLGRLFPSYSSSSSRLSVGDSDSIPPDYSPSPRSSFFPAGNIARAVTATKSQTDQSAVSISSETSPSPPQISPHTADILSQPKKLWFVSPSEDSKRRRLHIIPVSVPLSRTHKVLTSGQREKENGATYLSKNTSEESQNPDLSFNATAEPFAYPWDVTSNTIPPELAALLPTPPFSPLPETSEDSKHDNVQGRRHRRVMFVVENVTLVTPYCAPVGTLTLDAQSIDFKPNPVNLSKLKASLTPSSPSSPFQTSSASADILAVTTSSTSKYDTFSSPVLAHIRHLYATRSISLPLSALRGMYRRRYQLQRTALEIFTSDGKTLMFSLESSSDRASLLQSLAQFRLPNFNPLTIAPTGLLLRHSQLTVRWQRREISNFDYLMGLNMLAGRTYNDLNQYPVFPWVLSYYPSATTVEVPASGDENGNELDMEGLSSGRETLHSLDSLGCINVIPTLGSSSSLSNSQDRQSKRKNTDTNRDSVTSSSLHQMTLRHLTTSELISVISSAETHPLAPHIFRDLSKPVGALEPTRLESILSRFDSFGEAGLDIPPFHYGSHYSNAAVVSFYLTRLEPFASLHVELQAGRFDVADRSFSSVPSLWQTCLTSLSCFKELIPELFYSADSLRNVNGFDFGVRQQGPRVHDVALPSWANSPEEFVAINRAALESEFVSANLHHWIDLIFGYKQTGAAAQKSANLFCHLTYEHGIDLSSLQDTRQRESVISQIAQFGQTPQQLFNAPHPKREQLSRGEVPDIHGPIPPELDMRIFHLKYQMPQPSLQQNLFDSQKTKESKTQQDEKKKVSDDDVTGEGVGTEASTNTLLDDVRAILAITRDPVYVEMLRMGNLNAARNSTGNSASSKSTTNNEDFFGNPILKTNRNEEDETLDSLAMNHSFGLDSILGFGQDNTGEDEVLENILNEGDTQLQHAIESTTPVASSIYDTTNEGNHGELDMDLEQLLFQSSVSSSTNGSMMTRTSNSSAAVMTKTKAESEKSSSHHNLSNLSTIEKDENVDGSSSLSSHHRSSSFSSSLPQLSRRSTSQLGTQVSDSVSIAAKHELEGKYLSDGDDIVDTIDVIENFSDDGDEIGDIEYIDGENEVKSTGKNSQLNVKRTKSGSDGSRKFGSRVKNNQNISQYPDMAEMASVSENTGKTKASKSVVFDESSLKRISNHTVRGIPTSASVDALTDTIKQSNEHDSDTTPVSILDHEQAGSDVDKNSIYDYSAVDSDADSESECFYALAQSLPGGENVSSAQKNRRLASSPLSIMDLESDSATLVDQIDLQYQMDLEFKQLEECQSEVDIDSDTDIESDSIELESEIFAVDKNSSQVGITSRSTDPNVSVGTLVDPSDPSQLTITSSFAGSINDLSVVGSSILASTNEGIEIAIVPKRASSSTFLRRLNKIAELTANGQIEEAYHVQKSLHQTNVEPISVEDYSGIYPLHSSFPKEIQQEDVPALTMSGSSLPLPSRIPLPLTSTDPSLELPYFTQTAKDGVLAIHVGSFYVQPPQNEGENELTLLSPAVSLADFGNFTHAKQLDAGKTALLYSVSEHSTSFATACLVRFVSKEEAEALRNIRTALALTTASNKSVDSLNRFDLNQVPMENSVNSPASEVFHDILDIPHSSFSLVKIQEFMLEETSSAPLQQYTTRIVTMSVDTELQIAMAVMKVSSRNNLEESEQEIIMWPLHEDLCAPVKTLPLKRLRLWEILLRARAVTLASALLPSSHALSEDGELWAVSDYANLAQSHMSKTSRKNLEKNGISMSHVTAHGAITNFPHGQIESFLDMDQLRHMMIESLRELGIISLNSMPHTTTMDSTNLPVVEKNDDVNTHSQIATMPSESAIDTDNSIEDEHGAGVDDEIHNSDVSHHKGSSAPFIEPLNESDGPSSTDDIIRSLLHPPSDIDDIIIARSPTQVDDEIVTRKLPSSASIIDASQSTPTGTNTSEVLIESLCGNHPTTSTSLCRTTSLSAYAQAASTSTSDEDILTMMLQQLNKIVPVSYIPSETKSPNNDHTDETNMSEQLSNEDYLSNENEKTSSLSAKAQWKKRLRQFALAQFLHQVILQVDTQQKNEFNTHKEVESTVSLSVVQFAFAPNSSLITLIIRVREQSSQSIASSSLTCQHLLVSLSLTGSSISIRTIDLESDQFKNAYSNASNMPSNVQMQVIRVPNGTAFTSNHILTSACATDRTSEAEYLIISSFRSLRFYTLPSFENISFRNIVNNSNLTTAEHLSASPSSTCHTSSSPPLMLSVPVVNDTLDYLACNPQASITTLRVISSLTPRIRVRKHPSTSQDHFSGSFPGITTNTLNSEPSPVHVTLFHPTAGENGCIGLTNPFRRWLSIPLPTRVILDVLGYAKYLHRKNESKNDTKDAIRQSRAIAAADALLLFKTIMNNFTNATTSTEVVSDDKRASWPWLKVLTRNAQNKQSKKQNSFHSSKKGIKTSSLTGSKSYPLKHKVTQFTSFVTKLHTTPSLRSRLLAFLQSKSQRPSLPILLIGLSDGTAFAGYCSF